MRFLKSLFFIFLSISLISGLHVKKILNEKLEKQIDSQSESDLKENSPNKTRKFNYPDVRRDDTILDNYHGVNITDPYRWLENPDSIETKKFIEAQNMITNSYLNSSFAKETINHRLKEILNYSSYSCPERHGDKYYFSKQEQLKNQEILYVQDTLDSEEKVFFDVNELSSDGTISLTANKFSEDGSIFAYSLSGNGSDWQKIYFINAKTGEKYSEVLEQVKFSRLSWTHDNLGIFYGRFPQHNSTEGHETNLNENMKLYYHRIGTPQSEDVVVVEFPDQPRWIILAQVSDCGKWLIVTTTDGTYNCLIYITELKSNEKINGKLNLTQIVYKMDADYTYVGNDGTKAIFRTNKDAPNMKLIAIDLLNHQEENWQTLLPEDPQMVLQDVKIVDNDKFVAEYIHDVRYILQLHNFNGTLIKKLPLDIGQIREICATKKYSDAFFSFTSFLIPKTVYKLNLKQFDKPEIYREAKVANFNPNLYETKLVFYNTYDGTKIPMTIVMRKGAKLDGSMPALLRGYGGFNVIPESSFRSSQVIFTQHLKGIVAVAHIRGGGEYGEEWHDNGKLLKKQNVFDDFQSAAEYLIKHGYTSSDKLTIKGRSNGGLLMGTCLNQRPDLFGAAIVEFGVLDMLRYHRFTIGHAWVSEYGSPDNPEHFQNLIKYSPLHNVKPPNNVQYPATLVLSADHDDRVVPLHSLKFIATLQHDIGHLPQQTNPLMAKIETNTGHGFGIPTSKSIEETTLILTFIVESLGLKYQL